MSKAQVGIESYVDQHWAMWPDQWPEGKPIPWTTEITMVFQHKDYNFSYSEMIDSCIEQLEEIRKTVECPS